MVSPPAFSTLRPQDWGVWDLLSVLVQRSFETGHEGNVAPKTSWLVSRCNEDRLQKVQSGLEETEGRKGHFLKPTSSREGLHPVRADWELGECLRRGYRHWVGQLSSGCGPMGPAGTWKCSSGVTGIPKDALIRSTALLLQTGSRADGWCIVHVPWWLLCMLPSRTYTHTTLREKWLMSCQQEIWGLSIKNEADLWKMDEVIFPITLGLRFITASSLCGWECLREFHSFLDIERKVFPLVSTDKASGLDVEFSQWVSFVSLVFGKE